MMTQVDVLPVNGEAGGPTDSKVAELHAKRELLAEERATREIAMVDTVLQQERAKRAVIESLSVNGMDWVNRLDYLPSGYGFGNAILDMGYSAHTSNIADRYQGKDEPFIVTELDMARSRGMARLVTTINCPGVGIGENLQNYIIKRGYTHTAGDKKGAETPKGLISAVQDTIDDFLDLNHFQCDLDRELLWRDHRDGEFFVTFFPQKNGQTKIRTVEPDQVVDPGAPPFSEQELWERWNVQVDVASNWRLGVHTPDHDVQHRFGYSVRWEPNGDWDYVPAGFMVHSKRNTDRAVKRGLSDFYPAWNWLLKEARLLDNTSEGAARLAAIAYIVQHATSTQTEVESFRRAAADFQMDLTTQGGTKTIYRENRMPGEVLDVPLGQEYKAGPTGHERGSAFLEITQGILRQVATRFCMTEGMISGDDSNNNLASMVEAGSRFYNFAEACQGRMQARFQDIIWKAVYFAWRHFRYKRFGFYPGGRSFWELKRTVTVTSEPPDIDPKGKLERTEHRQILANAGVLSKKTWMGQEKLDHEEEFQNLEDEASMPGAEGPTGMPGGFGPPPGAGPFGGGRPKPPPAPENDAQQTKKTQPTTDSLVKQAVREAEARITKVIESAFGERGERDESLHERRPTVAVDLDGLLAEYDRWRGEDHIGPPREDAQLAMQALKDKGFCLIIFTTRGDAPRVAQWLMQHKIPYDHINENPFQPPDASGKIIADCYWDDRAVDGSDGLLKTLPDVVHKVQSSQNPDENPDISGHDDELFECDTSGPGHWVTLDGGKHVYVKETHSVPFDQQGDMAVEEDDSEETIETAAIVPGNIPALTDLDYPRKKAAENVFDGERPEAQAAEDLAADVRKAGEKTNWQAGKDMKPRDKGKVTMHGLVIAIENPRGSIRTGTTPDGTAWTSKLMADYGEILGTEGADADPVDVFIGPNPESEAIFIVDQINEDGEFDEHKVMLGWDNAKDAIEAYLANYQDGWEVGPVASLTMDLFKRWLAKGPRDRPATFMEDRLYSALETAATPEQALRAYRSQYP